MKLTDLLGCVGGATFFLLASAWIPVFGPFLSLLTPLPFLYYSTKLGLYQGIKLAAAAMLAIGLITRLTGYPQIILFGVEFSLLGLALSELMRRRFSLGQTIFFATAFMLVVGWCFLFFISLSKNVGPFEMISEYLQGHLKETIEAYEETGITKENALELEQYAKVFMDIISKIYPSLMIVGTGFAVWLNVIIARPLFRIGHLEYPGFISMDRWQTPESLVWGVIVSGFALFFSSGGITLIAVNVLIVIMVAYLFHGLSIVLFFLNKYNIPSWMRVGIYFLIIIQQLFLVVLALAGLFDQWIDFRKIHRRAQG
ncbi:MAG: YybS family protein [Pseudomonadota bacterium]